MAEPVSVNLPRGLFDPAGGQHREAVLRPVTGHFEMRLAELRSAAPEAVDGLLAASLDRVGAYTEITAAHAAALSRGDRDFLLLQLRRGVFGDRLDLVVVCPNPACRQSADLELRVSGLAPEPAAAAPEMIHAETPAGPALLREPTGADDASVAGLSGAAASALLWSRLVLDLAGQGTVSPQAWSRLDSGVRYAFALALAEAQSGPVLNFVSPCPSCGALMEVELDAAVLLAGEMGSAADRMFAEVHLLAYHYHWSEDAILSLRRDRRWRYLELLRRQAAGQPLTGVH
jgi:hypothetical protein